MVTSFLPPKCVLENARKRPESFLGKVAGMQHTTLCHVDFPGSFEAFFQNRCFSEHPQATLS